MAERRASGGIPEPGWYPDPAGTAGQRWWDGSRWTDRIESDGPHRADKPPPRRRGRRIALALTATACLLAATFLAGAVVGWRVFDDRALLGGSAQSPLPEVVEVRIPAFTGEDGGTMPDVRGLSHEAALEVLGDTVLAGEAPVVELRPWAGDPGVVIEQRPAFGAVDPVAITLVISEQAVVPDVAGRPLDEVVDELEALGTRVEVERRFEEGTDTDTILEVDPEPGRDLPASVRLIASERPTSVFLASLPTVEGSCRSGGQSVGGTIHLDALTCRVRTEPTDVAWLLSRAVERVEGVVGLPDDGSTDDRARVELLVDDEVVETHELTYGEPVAFDIAVSGGLRLTVRSVNTDEDASSFSNLDVVLGDVRLVGGADAMEALRDGS